MSRRIGLEISTTAVRMTEVASDDGRPRLLALAQVRLPAGAVVDGAIVDPPAVRAAIERCMAEGHFGGALRGKALKVRLGIAGLQAIMREVEMPPVPEPEIDSAVRLQALDIIPFPDDKTLMSARLIGSTTDDHGAPLMRVLLAAAHRDLVDPFIQCATDAGLRPEAVDLSASALVRALGGRTNAGEPEAIVSIGADLTTVVVHEAGSPLFVRTIAEGGNVATQAIATALDLPLADAEKLKRHLNDPGSPVPDEALHAAREGTARLLSEIRSSIDYFAALPGRTDVRRVVVTGAGAQLAELTERLQLQLVAPVVLGSVFAQIDISDLGAQLRPYDTVDLSSAAAVGLALPPEPGTKELDLLPPEVHQQQRRRTLESRVAAAAAAVVLVLVVTGALRWLSVDHLHQQLAQENTQITQLQARKASFDHINTEYQQLQHDSGLALPLVANEVNWLAVLSALRRYTPTNLSVNGGFAASQQPSATTATSSAPPSPTTVIATTNLAYTAPSSYDFNSWLNEMDDSGRFDVPTWSTVTNSNTSTNWSATIDVLGIIHSARIKQFEVAP